LSENLVMLANTGMPAGWRLETLGNLAHYVNGRAFKPEEWGETGRPIIRIEQISNPEAECDYVDGVVARDHVIDDGDLLFSWSATLTTLVWDRGPAALNQHIFKVMPKPGTDRDYLHHLLDYLIESLAGQAHGSTMQHIKKSDLLPYPVHVPPLDEQRRITEILDTADRAIGETEAVISKLKQMKTGLMHDLLTRGLEESGQLRDPDAHPEQFKDSPLGQIPREWKVAPLGSIAEMVTSGSRGWARYYSDEGPKFLRIGNLTREHINLRLNDLVHVRPPANGEGSRTQVKEGDLLISITADLGIIGVIPEHFGEAYVNQHIALVRLDYRAANPRWVGIYLAGDKAQKLFYRLNDSGAKAGLNLPTISALPIHFPVSREQHSIAEILDAHDVRIRAEEAYRDKLKLQKKGLMEDLLTGKVHVGV
jgi:type I restriction enzyme, S subunit